MTKARKAAGVTAGFSAFVKFSDGTGDNAAGNNDQEHTGNTTEDNSDAESEELFTARPVSAPAAPTVPAVSLPAADQDLSNNSQDLFGETLLTLAERYSNVEISRHVAMRFGHDPTTIGASGVSLRVTRALKARVTATNTTLDQAKNALKRAREVNGVTINNKKPKVEPAQQADAALATSAKVAQDGMDVEMTDAVIGEAQQGYTAAEKDAADALLLMCQTPPPSPPSQEVFDAASILMDMHRDDDSATEDEVSDTEMNDAEKAEFMADFQARWRPGT